LYNPIAYSQPFEIDAYFLIMAFPWARKKMTGCAMQYMCSVVSMVTAEHHSPSNVCTYWCL